MVGFVGLKCLALQSIGLLLKLTIFGIYELSSTSTSDVIKKIDVSLGVSLVAYPPGADSIKIF